MSMFNNGVVILHDARVLGREDGVLLIMTNE